MLSSLLFLLTMVLIGLLVGTALPNLQASCSATTVSHAGGFVRCRNSIADVTENDWRPRFSSRASVLPSDEHSEERFVSRTL